MKYIKKFNEEVENLSIKEWCEKFRLVDYTINDVDDKVDVNGWTNICNFNLKEIPIQFGISSNHFYCGSNMLISLNGCPRMVYGSFACDNNQLITLEGGPIEVDGDYDCFNNNLISLEGFPEKLGNEFWCEQNPIWEIYQLFDDDHKAYIDSLDYNYLKGDKIIRLRFQEALDEAGIEMPKSIPSYKYI